VLQPRRTTTSTPTHATHTATTIVGRRCCFGGGEEAGSESQPVLLLVPLPLPLCCWCCPIRADDIAPPATGSVSPSFTARRFAAATGPARSPQSRPRGISRDRSSAPWPARRPLLNASAAPVRRRLWWPKAVTRCSWPPVPERAVIAPPRPAFSSYDASTAYLHDHTPNTTTRQRRYDGPTPPLPSPPPSPPTTAPDASRPPSSRLRSP